MFAADHGVVEEGVSAFPQAVTAEMIRNFSRGGAAISVLAKENNASLSVINVGTVTELETLTLVENSRIAAGTQNFSKHQAMSAIQCDQAMSVGKEHIDSLLSSGIQLFIGGEMGIGNTTSATAIACSLLKKKTHELVGAGTGLDPEGINKKEAIIDKSLKLHHENLTSPQAILQCLGGFEIAALTGAYLHCAKMGIPVLIDGFISSVSALVAYSIQKESLDWFLFSHQSEEKGHKHLLAALNVKPLLNINMPLLLSSSKSPSISTKIFTSGVLNELVKGITTSVSSPNSKSF